MAIDENLANYGYTETEESIFDGYSNREVCVYVANITGGRVKLDENLPFDAIVTQAEDYL